VDDLVEAYEAFIDRASELKGSVLNMGGGPRFTLSLLELLAILEKGLGRTIHVSYADWRPANQRVYISGIQKPGNSCAGSRRSDRKSEWDESSPGSDLSRS